MPTRAPRLNLSFAGLEDAPSSHLSVDGMTPVGPNLSHWPGNRTPQAWRADLSTGICLAFARAEEQEQLRFLDGVETVLNDHYDTDGFGSLLAVLRPDVAMAREETLLAAAATGDFSVMQTWRGFAIDRIVANLAGERSPLRSEFAGLNGAAKSFQRYRWLLDHAEQVLDHPESLAPLYTDELAAIRAELQAGLAGAVQRSLHAELGFATVTTKGPALRMTLNTLAGAYRVLHVQLERDGTRFRYHDRTESWFELLTFQPLPRRDLRPLAEHLTQLEGTRGAGEGSWCADPPTEPIPELYFGLPGAQEYGQVSRTLLPSRLQPAVVEREVAAFFANASAATPHR